MPGDVAHHRPARHHLARFGNPEFVVLGNVLGEHQKAHQDVDIVGRIGRGEVVEEGQRA
jgi:hypothetical protein